MKKSFAVKKLTSARMAKALTSNVHDDIFSSFFSTTRKRRRKKKCMQISFLCCKQHSPGLFHMLLLVKTKLNVKRRRERNFKKTSSRRTQLSFRYPSTPQLLVSITSHKDV
jgi:hypothetical protein